MEPQAAGLPGRETWRSGSAQRGSGQSGGLVRWLPGWASAADRTAGWDLCKQPGSVSCLHEAYELCTSVG